MLDLFNPLIRGVAAFTATNLDDIIILMLFFSQVGIAFRSRHIVVGQYLGFAALVLVSLPGFFGSFIFPRSWIGLLGIVPIVIGLSQLLGTEEDEQVDDGIAIAPTAPTAPTDFPQVNWFSPQTVSVAAITIANGGDNVGIYIPLFANVNSVGLSITLAVFGAMVGLWCYAAYQLVRVEAIATLLTRYGRYLMPFVLMGLGTLILVDSHTLEHRGLTALAVTILGICVIRLLRLAAQASQSLSSLEVSMVEKVTERIEG